MADTAFILIVDAESPAARALRDELRGLGHACHLVESADEAVDSVRKRSPDVVIAEQRLSDGETGLALLGRAPDQPGQRADPDDRRAPTAASARAAIKEVGAFDVLVRPLADGERCGSCRRPPAPRASAARRSTRGASTTRSSRSKG
ncbi:MAG: response regulator [Phycisphaerae bacterium]